MGRPRERGRARLRGRGSGGLLSSVTVDRNRHSARRHNELTNGTPYAVGLIRGGRRLDARERPRRCRQ